MQLFNITDKGELIKIDSLPLNENDVYLVDDEEKNTIYIWVGLEVKKNKKDITAEIARRIDKKRGGSAKILIMKQKREYGAFLAMIHDLKKGHIPGKTIERRPEFVFETPLESINSATFEGISEERIVQWFQQIKNHRMLKVKEEEKESYSAVKFIKFEESSDQIQTEEISDVEAWLQQIKEHRKTKPKFIEITSEEPDLETQIRETAYFLSLDKYSYNELCWMLAEKIQKMNLDMPSIEDIKHKAEEVFNSSCTYDELCWLNAEMDLLIKKSFLEKEKKTFVY
ncbi:MAG: hypothetical protein ACFFDH_04300 [Promethearchaeota archaeon]